MKDFIFKNLANGRGRLILGLLVGHLLLVCAAGCHLGCELVEFGHDVAHEPDLDQSIAQPAGLGNVSVDFMLLLSAGLHFAGYVVLATESLGEVVIGEHVGVPTDDAEPADPDDPYAFDRWADDGGPCC